MFWPQIGGRVQRAAARSGREHAARHPDPDRARRDPRAAHDRPRAARAGGILRSRHGRAARAHRRSGGALGRGDLDVLADGRRLTRPPLGARRRGVRRGRAPERGDGRGDGARLSGRRTWRAPGTIAATAKHYVAYGQPEGGRDYNTVDVSAHRLRERLPRAVPRGGAGGSRIDHGVIQHGGRRADARQPRPADRRAQDRVGVRRCRGRRCRGRGEPAAARVAETLEDAVRAAYDCGAGHRDGRHARRRSAWMPHPSIRRDSTMPWRACSG